MGVVECLGRLAGDPNCVVKRELALALEPIAERFALDVRHGEPELARRVARIVD